MKVYNQLYKFACKSKQYTAGEVFFYEGDLGMVQPMLFLQKKISKGITGRFWKIIIGGSPKR